MHTYKLMHIRTHACKMYNIIVILSATYSILLWFRASVKQYLIASWTLQKVSEPGEALVLLLQADDVLMEVEH